MTTEAVQKALERAAARRAATHPPVVPGEASAKPVAAVDRAVARAAALVASPVERALARAAARRLARGEQTDMERILALPVVEDDGRDWTATFRTDAAFPALRPVQNRAFSSAALVVDRPPTGVVLAAGVGHGKTLTGFLLPAVFGAKNPLLVVPARMRGATFKAWAYWKRGYNLPDIDIITYNDLSHTDEGGDLLWDLVPDLVIFDEAHFLRHMKAARTKRVARYLQNHQETRLVMMSGTLIRTSLFDVSHLFAWALRDQSPLPLDKTIQEIWASVVDVRSEPDSRAVQALAPLKKWADAPSERAAIYRRLSTAPGVVTTKDSSYEGALILVPTEPPEADLAELRAVMARVEATWELPDGTCFVEASHMAQVLKQLAVGFYYALDWPDGIVDHEWLDARRALDRAVRNELEYRSTVHYDSPALVLRAARAGRAPVEVMAAVAAWDLVKDRPEPPRVTTWVTEAVVRYMVDLARRQPSAILWYTSTAVELKLAEFGLKIHGKGSKAPTEPSSWGWDASRWPACSVLVHGTGANLQAWNTNVMVESPSSGATWEQVLGRTHRLGQDRDEVVVYHLLHCPAYERMLERSREDAEFLAETSGQLQKLQMASWAEPEDVDTSILASYEGMDEVWNPQ